MRSRCHVERVLYVLVSKRKLVISLQLVCGETGRGRRPSKGGLVKFDGDGTRHICMNAKQSLWCLGSELIDDEGSPVPALGHKLVVAEPLH
ncbi:hypothetical protein D3C87_2008640 [compost metagenome]